MNVYEKLNDTKQEIRLLTLHPTLTNNDELMQASLHTISLKKAQMKGFEALSYCWGEPTLTKPIILNGHSVQVTANLEAALLHLRDAKNPVTLWVDALCINQRDSVEKTGQIQIMADVYRSASSVVAWLGEQQDDSDFALEKCTEWGSAHLSKDSRYLVECCFQKPFDTRAWIAVNKLLRRPYWHRRWVYQELTFGHNVIVQVGRAKTSWNTFRGLVEAWYQVERKLQPIRQDLTPEEYELVDESPLRELLIYVSFDPESEDPHPRLLSLLQHTGKLECTDPRDRIYALIGPAKDSQQYPMPDYSKSVAEVYTDFASTHMIITQRLDLLADAACRLSPLADSSSNSINCSGIPSWVPDWRVSLPRVSGGRMPFRADPQSSFYNADNDYDIHTSIPSDQLLPNKTDFCPSGLVVDRIFAWFPSDVEDMTLSWILQFIWKASNGHPNYLDGSDVDYTNIRVHRPTGLPLMWVLFRTLLLDMDFRLSCRLTDWEKDSSASALSILLQLGEGFLLLLARDFGLLGNIVAATEGEDAPDSATSPFDALDFDFLPASPKLDPDFARFTSFKAFCAEIRDHFPFCLQMMVMVQQHIKFFSEGRRLFVTEKGHIGLGTCGLDIGDMVTIIHGCNVPILLREKGQEGQKWERLTGDAFVYGLMDGEAMTDEFWGGEHGRVAATKRFCIR